MSESDDIGALDGSSARPDLDLLYRNHAPGLRRRLRARVRSHDEANDLVQDAFARLLGARSLARVGDPGAFLNRIIRNLLIDRSRRLSARPPHVSIVDEIAVPPDQGQAIEVEQMRQRYRDLVALLPPRTREVSPGRGAAAFNRKSDLDMRGSHPAIRYLLNSEGWSTWPRTLVSHCCP